jgi:hypothetical protein
MNAWVRCTAPAVLGSLFAADSGHLERPLQWAVSMQDYGTRLRLLCLLCVTALGGCNDRGSWRHPFKKER